MSSIPVIELVYFAGCPNVDAAREALKRALTTAGLAPVWQEWVQGSTDAPARVWGLGSPTILVAGRDVTGVGVTSDGPSCRADTVPSSDMIAAALTSAGLV